MAAYIIARVNVTDWDQYREYMKVTPGLMAEFGGKFMSRGGDMETLEGPEETDRVVLVEFPTHEQAKAFYHSAGYQQAIALRAGAATAQFIVVDGIE